jgi:hypothetical protein
MQKVDLNTPEDRKKLIIAAALGLVALVFLWWTFFGFGSSTTSPKTTRTSPTRPGPSPGGRPEQQPSDVAEIKDDPLVHLQPIRFDYSLPPATEAKRNIFSFYEPPPRPEPVAQEPPATPTPTPPVLLASVQPSNVYARTADFTLEVAGDKFTPNLRILIDGRELPTRYVGPQQLTGRVPAAMIASPGQRQVMVRSADGAAYSNAMMLNVAQPPTPNYTYVGIIGTPTYSDTAILRDGSNREILNVQRGDVLAGRFRVTSISEKELVLTDTTLKIRHSLPFTVDGERGYNPLQRPTPRVDSEDDEP